MRCYFKKESDIRNHRIYCWRMSKNSFGFAVRLTLHCADNCTRKPKCHQIYGRDLFKYINGRYWTNLQKQKKFFVGHPLWNLQKQGSEIWGSWTWQVNELMLCDKIRSFRPVNQDRIMSSCRHQCCPCHSQILRRFSQKTPCAWALRFSCARK